MATSPNASLIPQIKDAYQKSIGASRGTLGFGIDCGDLLNKAKEATPKKEWLAWLGDKLPEIPQTTASLYMRLATNKDLFDKQRVASLTAKGPLSIRAAAKLIPPTDAAIRAATTTSREQGQEGSRRSRERTARGRAWLGGLDRPTR